MDVGRILAGVCWVWVLCVLFLGARTVSVAEPEAAPNLVVFHVDDLGWADVGRYGSRYFHTPHIDALAERGMTFTHAYAPAAVCSPSRAALLTGRYPARIGITDWIRARFQGGHLPPDGRNPDGWESPPDRRLAVPRNPLWLEPEEITLAELLKDAGYRTGHVGKWHLGLDPYGPESRGFEFNAGGCDYGQPPSFFDPYTNPRLPEGIPHLPPRREGEYLTFREADEAVRFLREGRERPFFLHYASYAVHTPIQAPEELVEKYRAVESPGLQQDPVYAAMVDAVDQAVGTVVGALRELGVEDRTLVVFTSDNGGLEGYTSNAPLRSGKGYPYEGGIRVPLIVVWPGVVSPGTVSHEPVLSMDLFPTLLDVAGVEPPGDRAVDGLSLEPILRGRTRTLDREAIFWHFPHYRHPGFAPYSVVRAREWKLIRFYDPERVELYNVVEDVGETTDFQRTERGTVERLGRLLDEWLAEVGAKVPKPNPRYGKPAD